MRRLAPGHRMMASFRHDNPEAIVNGAFIQFCCETGLVSG
jgi:hypothetical protein